MIGSPMCIGCTHLIGTLLDTRCEAFPDGIPADILLSKFDHRGPHQGDSGIVFEPSDAAAAEYAGEPWDQVHDDSPQP